jgi:hypothetical protein
VPYGIDPSAHFVNVNGVSYEVSTYPEHDGRNWYVFLDGISHQLREWREGETRDNGFGAIEGEARAFIVANLKT